MPARPARVSGHSSSHGSKKAHGRRTRSKRVQVHGGEEGGAERWLVTYADMLTLLLVLFIVLFSISVVNTSKFIALKTSLASAFGSGQQSILDGGTSINDSAADGTGQQLVNPGMPQIPSPVATPPVTAQQGATTVASTAQAGDYSAAVLKEVDNYKQIQRAIDRALAARGMSGTVQFAIDRRGLVITVVTNALVFPGNSADLLPAGQKILGVIAPPLGHVPNAIEVDGHTNQQNVSTYPYPSGWELSSARASSVVRYLAASGVAQSRLEAVGFSDQRPLYPASDPRSVTRNRRVEIIVLSTLPAAAGDALQAAGSR